MKKISVIIPVYNSEAYIAQCVQSLIAQTYQNWEALLIDGGSTDRSAELCRNCCRRDSRVRLIEQENQGASAARNKGIERSRGERVVSVDSDDAIFPDLLSMTAEEQSAELLIFDFTFTRQRTAECFPCCSGHMPPTRWRIRPFS